MALVYPLPGKVALVTGAARGIGFETARLLHARGASVTVIDLAVDETEAAAKQIGERTLAIAADVTDEAAMEDAVERTVGTFGGLDVVVANAGIAPPARPMSVVDAAAFERVIEIDLLGVWRTVHPALTQVIERRGHVVVVASVYAFVNGAMATPYAVSKAGVEQLGRALRAELAIHGASASVAYFGFIDTKLVQRRVRGSGGRQRRGDLPRLGQPPAAALRRRRGDRRRDRAPRAADHPAALVAGALGAARDHQPALRRPHAARRAHARDPARGRTDRQGRGGAARACRAPLTARSSDERRLRHPGGA